LPVPEHGAVEKAIAAEPGVEGPLDPAADLALLMDAAREAGEIAMRFWRAAPRTWEKPDDAGPVTEADLAVDAFLAQQLRSARPSYGWMSEETPDDPRDREPRVMFVVDPIDGTRAYARGEEAWAVAVAVVRDGEAIAGVVHMPAKQGRVYAAHVGSGATRDGRPMQARSATPGLDAAEMLVTRPNLAPGLWRGDVPTPERHFRPSLAYRLALVGEGRFDGMLTLRDAWVWDVAAGALIAAEAGARVTDREGAPLRHDRADRKTAGVLAAPASLHSETLQRLAPRARIE
jgi:myo-inositol-1(or 4)-monophosphatase